MRRPSKKAVVVTAVVVAVVALGGWGIYRTVQNHDSQAPPAAGPSDSPSDGAPQAVVPALPAPRARPSGVPRFLEAQGWGKREGGRPESTKAPLFKVDHGTPGDGQFDRVTFFVLTEDIVGFEAEYLKPGTPVDAAPVTGGAVLQVTIRAPVGRVEGKSAWTPKPETGAVVVAPSGGPKDQAAVQEVKYAGPFGDTASIFNFGVREDLPINVGSYAKDGCRFIYIDIAHYQS